MQFLQRVRAVWAWLPAFRAVAETEHLPTAARELGLAPSSLSRSIKVLEQQVGAALFDRSGQTLALNDAGRILLDAVRGSMRMLDEALGSAGGDAMTGTITLAVAAGGLPVLVATACESLRRAHPDLRVSVVSSRDDLVDGMLLRGEIDAAIVSRTARHTELSQFELCRLACSAFARDPVRALSQAPLECVVVGGRTQVVDDGWPTDVPRNIRAWAHDEVTALEISARGDLVVVVADAVVARSGLRVAPLLEVPVGPRVLHVVHRRVLGMHPRTDALTDALRAAVQLPPST